MFSKFVLAQIKCGRETFHTLTFCILSCQQMYTLQNSFAKSVFKAFRHCTCQSFFAITHFARKKKLLLIKVQIKQVLLLKEQFSFLALSKAIKMTLKLMIFHCLSNCNFLLKFHKTGLIKNDR